jgi:NADH:ubiquinone oxidoreductase subunit F (NADH-binding)
MEAKPLPLATLTAFADYVESRIRKLDDAAFRIRLSYVKVRATFYFSTPEKMKEAVAQAVAEGLLESDMTTIDADLDRVFAAVASGKAV